MERVRKCILSAGSQGLSKKQAANCSLTLQVAPDVHQPTAAFYQPTDIATAKRPLQDFLEGEDLPEIGREKVWAGKSWTLLPNFGKRMLRLVKLSPLSRPRLQCSALSSGIVGFPARLGWGEG